MKSIYAIKAVETQRTTAELPKLGATFTRLYIENDKSYNGTRKHPKHFGYKMQCLRWP